MISFFKRQSTKITVSEFYENFTTNKYRFDVAYQRNSGIWSDEKQSFLIDTILKNYPIPAIYMRPSVDSATGKTAYDIIDGKQRLQTIIAFIEDSIPLSSGFAEDTLAFNDDSKSDIDDEIAGKLFSEIKQDIKKFEGYIKQFWTYALQVEYLYEDRIDLIASVFDRLNRNGEPLLRQELRNAKYHSSELIQTIKSISDSDFWKERLEKLGEIRMEDEEFISELFFLVGEKGFFDSNQKVLDDYYEKYVSGNKKDNIKEIRSEFDAVTSFIQSLSFNYDGLKRLQMSTHLYGFFAFAHHCVTEGIAPVAIKDRLFELYSTYFTVGGKQYYSGALKDYKDSCSSRTRSAEQRKKRLNAILEYCELPPLQ